jgi:hypothetical protein
MIGEAFSKASAAMFGTRVASTIMSFKDVHPEKAPFLILVTDSGIYKDSSAVQSAKHLSPIVSNDSGGYNIAVIPVHPQKHSLPRETRD